MEAYLDVFFTVLGKKFWTAGCIPYACFSNLHHFYLNLGLAKCSDIRLRCALSVNL